MLIKESNDPMTAIRSAQSTFKAKAEKHRLKKLKRYMAAMNDNGIVNFYGNKVEDEWTRTEKNYASNLRRVSNDAAHSTSWQIASSILQRSKNAA